MNSPGYTGSVNYIKCIPWFEPVFRYLLFCFFSKIFLNLRTKSRFRRHPRFKSIYQFPLPPPHTQMVITKIPSLLLFLVIKSLPFHSTSLFAHTQEEEKNKRYLFYLKEREKCMIPNYMLGFVDFSYHIFVKM